MLKVAFSWVARNDCSKVNFDINKHIMNTAYIGCFMSEPLLSVYKNETEI